MRSKKKTSRTKHKIKTDNTRATLIRRSLSERSWTLHNWYRHIHWRNSFVIVIVPLIGLYLWLITDVKLTKQTFYLAVFNYTTTLISINILYHRFWSHHTFNINNDRVVLFLAILCSGGGITSAKNWCSAHRAHHRYCDIANRDPHNIRKGLVFSHVGWMVIRHNSQVAKVIEESKLDDLPNENIVQWQSENYLPLFTIVGLGIPCLFAGWFWNDYIGGLIFAGFLKVVMVQHAVFSVNSFGHTVGLRPFSDSKSARDNPLLSLITLGEGYQNFHHEFPMDYRNGNEWFSIDPTKWTLVVLSWFGIISDLKTASRSMIDKSFVQQQQKLIDNKRSQLNWGIPIEKLPVFTPDEFKSLSDSSKDKYLVIVSGIIHDVTPFAKDHPGGLPLIKASHGKDATTAFNGAVYQHSNAARNLLATMRIGVLGGSENLFWKQQRVENKAVPIDNDSDGNRIVRSGAQATFNKGFGGIAGAA
ncbi:hypothetical protein CANARDRAFT_196970 [[Candida] arabinofermentans NRRL YB-2248]|uniref:Acyl-CoA desaturase n=1 Tax=[Candida] arabinofermentans NRRL YB-2248 TaxID=983967 RepID=A0A1E4T403_9ASCO|nr:hypothetical protein CANARDRAFT_196970 [[Candida] arabinofermentans NRRL YB-2248]